MFTSVVMACRTASPLVTRGRSPPALPTAQPVQPPKRDGADCVHARCFPLNCASACAHTSACCLAAARVFAPATRIIKRLQRARYAHGSEAANESRDLHNRNAVPLHLAHSTSSAAPVATAACISHVSLRHSQAGKSKLLTCSTGNHPSQRTLAVSWQSSRERSPSRSTWCAAPCDTSGGSTGSKRALELEGQAAHNGV